MEDRTGAVVAAAEEVVEVEVTLVSRVSTGVDEGEAVTPVEGAKGIIIGEEDEAHLQRTLAGWDGIT